MKNWKLIEKIQKLRPGWRFSLLGGDHTMGCAVNGDGSLKRNNGDLVVVESSSLPFGWRAEFFGEADPRLDYGDRHASGTGCTADEAIKKAYEKAMEKIVREDELNSYKVHL